MTLEDAIKNAERNAEMTENVKYEDVALLYCDDTECTEYHLERCRLYAKEQRQLAEWLKDYKSLKETGEPTLAKWIHQDKLPDSWEVPEGYMMQAYRCSKCNGLAGFQFGGSKNKYCPYCGAKMEA